MLQCKSPQLINSQVSTTCKYSMIFKTFDKDSDKILSKIGLLGKSFEQIGASIRQRKIDHHLPIGNHLGEYNFSCEENEEASPVDHKLYLQ